MRVGREQVRVQDRGLGGVLDLLLGVMLVVVVAVVMVMVVSMAKQAVAAMVVASSSSTNHLRNAHGLSS